jgi:hypothetical protein
MAVGVASRSRRDGIMLYAYSTYRFLVGGRQCQKARYPHISPAFEDLRDGTHGGSASRKDKEAHFEKAVQRLAPIARQVLTEMNASLLLDTGQLTETGLRRTTG